MESCSVQPKMCSRQRKSTEPAAQILGMHIEGPYINVKYKGAQPVEGIRDPTRKSAANCWMLLGDGFE
jgi:N-acetylglucosamine-6-phosphate deacetylase